MTEVIRYVNTDSTAGGDGTTSGITGATRAYASLSEWEAAEQTDLVSAGNTHTVKCLGSAVHTGSVTVGGWTTAPTNGIHITVHEDRRHNGMSGVSDCRIEPSTAGHVFTVSQNNLEVSWFEIANWTGGSAEAFRIAAESGVFHHIIAHDAADTFSDVFYPSYSSSSGVVKIYNCEAWNIGRTFCLIQDSQNKAVHISNCTIINAGNNNNTQAGVCAFDDGSNRDNTGSTMFVTNVVASGRASSYPNRAFKGGGDFGQEGTIAIKNCVSNDLSAITGVTGFETYQGTNQSGVIMHDQFVSVNPSGFDLHLLSTSSLVGSGVDLSADAILPFSDDVAGTTRTTPWDIGAFSFVVVVDSSGTITAAAAAAAAAAKSSHQYNNDIDGNKIHSTAKYVANPGDAGSFGQIYATSGYPSVGTSEVEFTSMIDRRVMTIKNNGSAILYVGPSGNSVANLYPIPTGSEISFNATSGIRIYGKTSASTTDVTIIELA